MGSSTRRVPAARTHRGPYAAAAALLVVLIASGVLITRNQAEQRRAFTARFDSRQATAARFIEAYVTAVYEREKTLADRSFTGPVDNAAFAKVAADQGFDAAVLLDSAGRLLASQPNNPKTVGADMTVRYAHLRSAVTGTPAVLGVVPSVARGLPIIGFAVPFETPTGLRVFSGGYAVEATPLAPFVRNVLPFRTAKVAIVDTAGTVVSGNRAGTTGRPLQEFDLALPAFAAPSGFTGAAAERRYVSQSDISGTSWRLVFTVGEDELFASIGRGSQVIPWLALGAFALSAMLALAAASRYLVQRDRAADSEIRTRLILDSAVDGFVGMDANGTITEWNTAAGILLGWSAAEAIGRPLVELVIPPELREAHAARIAEARSGSCAQVAPLATLALNRAGERIAVALTLQQTPRGSGWESHAFLRDIGEQLRHEAQLRDLAQSDGLTGLGNRRAAVERLTQALSRAQRQGSPVAVLFIDVDRFKAVNDQYGHAAGDTVLKEIARRLRAVFRTEDSLARIGGDEFLVVCEDLHSGADAHLLAGRTRAALAARYLVDGEDVDVTASVGLAMSDSKTTVEGMLAAADADMYAAKATAHLALAATTAGAPQNHR